jgi:hypothetical protein
LDKCNSNASIIDFKDHTNIPEFQKNSPLSRNTLAISELGFSVKVLTSFKFSSPSYVLSLLI